MRARNARVMRCDNCGQNERWMRVEHLGTSEAAKERWVLKASREEFFTERGHQDFKNFKFLGRPTDVTPELPPGEDEDESNQWGMGRMASACLTTRGTLSTTSIVMLMFLTLILGAVGTESPLRGTEFRYQNDTVSKTITTTPQGVVRDGFDGNFTVTVPVLSPTKFGNMPDTKAATTLGHALPPITKGIEEPLPPFIEEIGGLKTTETPSPTVEPTPTDSFLTIESTVVSDTPTPTATPSEGIMGPEPTVTTTETPMAIPEVIAATAILQCRVNESVFSFQGTFVCYPTCALGTAPVVISMDGNKRIECQSIDATGSGHLIVTNTALASRVWRVIGPVFFAVYNPSSAMVVWTAGKCRASASIVKSAYKRHVYMLEDRDLTTIEEVLLYVVVLTVSLKVFALTSVTAVLYRAKRTFHYTNTYLTRLAAFIAGVVTKKRVYMLALLDVLVQILAFTCVCEFSAGCIHPETYIPSVVGLLLTTEMLTVAVMLLNITPVEQVSSGETRELLSVPLSRNVIRLMPESVKFALIKYITRVLDTQTGTQSLKILSDLCFKELTHTLEGAKAAGSGFGTGLFIDPAAALEFAMSEASYYETQLMNNIEEEGPGEYGPHAKQLVKDWYKALLSHPPFRGVHLAKLSREQRVLLYIVTSNATTNPMAQMTGTSVTKKISECPVQYTCREGAFVTDSNPPGKPEKVTSKGPLILHEGKVSRMVGKGKGKNTSKSKNASAVASKRRTNFSKISASTPAVLKQATQGVSNSAESRYKDQGIGAVNDALEQLERAGLEDLSIQENMSKFADAQAWLGAILAASGHDKEDVINRYIAGEDDYDEDYSEVDGRSEVRSDVDTEYGRSDDTRSRKTDETDDIFDAEDGRGDNPELSGMSYAKFRGESAVTTSTTPIITKKKAKVPQKAINETTKDDNVARKSMEDGKLQIPKQPEVECTEVVVDGESKTQTGKGIATRTKSEIISDSTRGELTKEPVSKVAIGDPDLFEEFKTLSLRNFATGVTIVCSNQEEYQNELIKIAAQMGKEREHKAKLLAVAVNRSLSAKGQDTLFDEESETSAANKEERCDKTDNPLTDSNKRTNRLSQREQESFVTQLEELKEIVGGLLQKRDSSQPTKKTIVKEPEVKTVTQKKKKDKAASKVPTHLVETRARAVIGEAAIGTPDMNPPRTTGYLVFGLNLNGERVEHQWAPQMLSQVGQNAEGGVVVHAGLCKHTPDKTICKESEIKIQGVNRSFEITIPADEWCYGTFRRREEVCSLSIRFPCRTDASVANATKFEVDLEKTKASIGALSGAMKPSVGMKVCYQGIDTEGQHVCTMGKVIRIVDEDSFEHNASISQPGTRSGAGLSNGRISLYKSTTKRWHSYGCHAGYVRANDTNLAMLGVATLPSLSADFR